MMCDFNSLINFDFSNVTPLLWVFKKSTSVNGPFTAHFVPTDQSLKMEFSDFIQNDIENLVSTNAYTCISQVYENQCLNIPCDQTTFGVLQTLVNREENLHSLPNTKYLQNISGYVVKFYNADTNTTIYAVKNSSPSFKTKFKKSYINVIMYNGELSIIEEPSFTIHKKF